MNKKLFFYELEGRGYSFHNKNWDEVKHGFKDDMLNMAWEMWSSGQAVKAQTPESNALLSAAMDAVQKLGSGNFVLVPKEPTLEMIAKGHDVFVGAFDSKLNGGQSLHCAYLAMIEAQEQSDA